MASWLQERTATVIVDNAKSASYTIRNAVFQGTVWGPPPWNTYFGRSAKVITDEVFLETLFADDLNAYKEYLTRKSCKISSDARPSCMPVIQKPENAAQ